MLHGEEDESPIQSDCYNCGIYAILAAKFTAEGIPILATTIRQSSMPLYRKLIAAVHLDRFQLPQRRLTPSPSGDKMVLVLEDDKGAGGEVAEEDGKPVVSFPTIRDDNDKSVSSKESLSPMVDYDSD